MGQWPEAAEMNSSIDSGIGASGYGESPSKLRIRQLSEKLTGLASGLEAEKLARKENILSKLRTLDERVQNNQISERNKFNVIRNQIVKLQEGMNNERMAREMLEERKAKEFKLIENSILLDLNVEKQHRKDAEQLLIKNIDEKCFGLRLALAKEKKKREDSEEFHGKLVSKKMSTIHQALNADVMERTSEGECLNKRLSHGVARLRQELTLERKVREEAEHTMLRMLEEMCGKIQDDVRLERDDRQGTEDMLLKLLEETCNRVEQGAT